MEVGDGYIAPLISVWVRDDRLGRGEDRRMLVVDFVKGLACLYWRKKYRG